MKKILSVLTCVLLLALSGCGAGNGDAGQNSAESGISSHASDNAESPKSDSDSGGSAVKVLAREYIHRTDQDGQVSSYRAPIYTETALYDGFERYTPDDILLETVEERTYEMDEAGRTLAYSPLNEASTTSFVFDEAGRLTEYKCIHSNGARLYWYALSYDDSGRLVQKNAVNSDESQGSAVWSYTYDGSGNIIRRDDPYGEWTEYTYDEEGYPLTAVSYDEDGERYGEWSSFEYEEIDVEPLPAFMGSAKQWILADLVY